MLPRWFSGPKADSLESLTSLSLNSPAVPKLNLAPGTGPAPGLAPRPCPAMYSWPWLNHVRDPANSLTGKAITFQFGAIAKPCLLAYMQPK